MGRNKKYSGYKAYQYLEPGLDYRAFKLAKEFNRVPTYLVQLSKSEEERVEEIVRKNILISLHDHPVFLPDDISECLELEHAGRESLAYEALSVSGLDCIFDNLMDGNEYITSYNGWKWTDAIHDIGMRLSDIYHQDMIVPCHSVRDITDVYENGRIALVMCLESASPIENELDRIDVLYGLGIRSMGICYSESNMLGGGKGETDMTTGLSDFGYDAVKRMNKLGMLIDVAHTNDKTSLETIEASDKPIYSSHSGPATLAGVNGKSDEVLHALAEKDGMIGLVVAGSGLCTAKNPMGNIEGYMECLEYCIKIMGIDYVGCGPDCLYGDHQGLYKYWLEHNSIGHYSKPGRHASPLETKPIGPQNPGYVVGLENLNEFVNIPRWMVKHGYSDAEISKVIGANAIRMLEKVWV